MAERTEGTIDIEASTEEIMAAICDFESYPEWAEGIRSAKVLERDDRSRPVRVAFSFSAMGFSADYELVYEHADDGSRVSWTTAEASGAVKDVQGEYVLEARDGDTEVTYRLAVELGVPLPGFVRRRADRAAIRSALQGLKGRVEA